MGSRLCSARQSKRGGKVLIPCKPKWRAASQSQRLLPFPCYLSLMAAFWFSRYRRRTWFLVCEPVTNSGSCWEKKVKICHVLELIIFLSRSLPEGRLSLATNNSPAHQSLFLRFKIIEICFFLCVGVYIYEWMNIDVYTVTAPYICIYKYV